MIHIKKKNLKNKRKCPHSMLSFNEMRQKSSTSLSESCPSDPSHLILHPSPLSTPLQTQGSLFSSSSTCSPSSMPGGVHSHTTGSPLDLSSNVTSSQKTVTNPPTYSNHSGGPDHSTSWGLICLYRSICWFPQENRSSNNIYVS